MESKKKARCRTGKERKAAGRSIGGMQDKIWQDEENEETVGRKTRRKTLQACDEVDDI